METVWSFETKRFRVTLSIEQEYGFEYDGDDEDGETQRALNEGELVAFDSVVRVYLDGNVIASDCLGGSVYKAGEESEFWSAHRDTNPMNRNCMAMRKARGNVTICHYFPSMVAEAIRQARENICSAPRVRCAA